MTDSGLILYELPGCPFCARVKVTLDELDLEYETKTVPSSHSQRTEVENVSGQTGVPVLVDEGSGERLTHRNVRARFRKDDGR